jgi:DEAD/DEAH box helicase domain-containing protein
MRKIFFDIETRNTFQEANTNDPADLDISVVCIYDTETETSSSYLQEELPKLWPILEKADLLIGYNSEHFDMPLLNKYYAGDLSKIKHVDLLKEIKASLGRRIKLDDIADATLGRKKIAHGLEAIEWWKSGEIDKIIKYCIEDVMITKAVYDYAMKHKKLKYKEFGKLKDISLDPSNWETKEDTSMTFSLPF